MPAKATPRPGQGTKRQSPNNSGKISKPGKPGKTGSGKLRIVGGRFRGKKLETLGNQDIRPTSDRVRESLFNLLDHLVLDGRQGSPLVDARVMDRFAGTGALGLEALSRGASDAWFIDRHAAARKLIGQNLATATGQNTPSNGIRIGDEGLLALGNASLRRPFDIIFCDPPYGFADWQALVDGFDVANLAHPGTLLVAETDRKDGFPDLSMRWETLKDRAIGRTRLQVFVRKMP